MLKRFSICLCVLLVLAAWGSAAAAPKNPDEAAPVVFYPPAPSPPRIQFLAKFSSAYDLSEGSSRMRDFVFGGADKEEQVIDKPYGVAIFEGAIFAVDTRGSGYVVFDMAAGKWRRVQGYGDGQMKKPINITIDTDGTRYVTDTQRELVIVFDRNDRFVRTIGEAGQFKPVDVAVYKEHLYVTDIAHQKIHVLDKLTGQPMFTFGEPGSDPGKMAHPTNLALGPDGTVYLSDMTNFRVQHFTPEGEFIRQLGSVGTGYGQFARPKGVAVDREGRIYVADAAFQNVQLFDDDGAVLMFFGGPGDGPGSMYLPTAVKIDYDNVGLFRKYAAPGFEIEYLILVANQFGQNKVAVYGFGAMTADPGDAIEGER